MECEAVHGCEGSAAVDCVAMAYFDAQDLSF